MKPISENEARATRWGRCDNKIAEDRYVRHRGMFRWPCLKDEPGGRDTSRALS